MKIILTTTSPSMDSELDPRFGRCRYFLLVDTDTMEWQALPNPGIDLPGGAGIQAAQFVANQKVDAVVSGDFGPNAFQVLNTAGVPMYRFGSCQTARQVIDRFKDGQLERFDEPSQDNRPRTGRGMG